MLLYRLIRILTAWFRDLRNARTPRLPVTPGTPGPLSTTIAAGQKAGQRRGRAHASATRASNSSPFLPGSLPEFVGRDGFPPIGVPGRRAARDAILRTRGVFAPACIGVGAWQAASGITHRITLSFRLPRPLSRISRQTCVTGYPSTFHIPHTRAGLAIRRTLRGCVTRAAIPVRDPSFLLLAAAGAGVPLPASPGRCTRRIAAPHRTKGAAYVPSHPACVRLCLVSAGLSGRPSRRDRSRR
jgi:hypothetical protein